MKKKDKETNTIKQYTAIQTSHLNNRIWQRNSLVRYLSGQTQRCQRWQVPAIYLCSPVAGTGPALFHRYFLHPPYFGSLLPFKLTTFQLVFLCIFISVQIYGQITRLSWWFEAEFSKIVQAHDDHKSKKRRIDNPSSNRYYLIQ